MYTGGGEDNDGLVLTVVRPGDVEAIEVYNNETKLPTKFRWNPKASRGVVLLWTRRGFGTQKQVPTARVPAPI